MGFASGKLAPLTVRAPTVSTSMTPGGSPYDRRRPPSEGLGGYFTNIARDFRDFVTGMATVGGNVIADSSKLAMEGLTLGEFESGGYSDFSKGVLHDIAKAGAEAATLGQIDTGGGVWDVGGLGDGYVLAPAIGQDYANRYGSVQGFLRGLYEHPLAFASDVATVATAGSYGAARFGTAASRIPRIAEELAMLADDPAAAVGRTARLVSKIQGKPTAVMTAEGAVDLVPPAYSPIRRLYQRGLGKILTRPVEQLDNEILNLRNLVEEATPAERPQLQAQLANMERFRNIAREGGITRILRPRVEQFKLRQIADHLIGTSGSRFIHERERLTREFGEILSQIPEELDAAAAVHALQLLDPSMLVDDAAIASRVTQAAARTERSAARAGVTRPALVEAMQIAMRNIDELNDVAARTAPVGERIADLGAERAWLRQEIDRVANRRVGSQATVSRVGPTIRFDPTTRRIGGYRDYRTMLEARLTENEREISRLGEIAGMQEGQRQLAEVAQGLPDAAITPSEYRAALRAMEHLSPQDFAATARAAFGEGGAPLSYEDFMYRVNHAATDTPYLERAAAEGANPAFLVRDPIGRELGRMVVSQGDLPDNAGRFARVAGEGFGPGVLGPRGVRSVLRELHNRFPEVREWRVASREGRPLVRLRVPPERLPPPEVRRLLAPDVRIGLSEHADYVAARSNMAPEYQPFVTLHSPRELQEMGARTFLTEDHSAGYYLSPDGEIGGLFTAPNAEPGVGKALMVHAIQNGGTYLFNYDGFLTRYYSKFGFRPFASLPFNPDYAPVGWDYERFGSPRVVWMRYEGGPRESIAERYGTFRPVEPLATIPRAGGPAPTLGAGVAPRPRPGVVEGEPGAAGRGVPDDLAARPVEQSFTELSSADQQAAIVDAGYPEVELGEMTRDVVMEDLRLWDQQLYMAPDVVDRVERLVNNIWDRHPLANQPLPDTLFDPDPYVRAIEEPPEFEVPHEFDPAEYARQTQLAPPPPEGLLSTIEEGGAPGEAALYQQSQRARQFWGPETTARAQAVRDTWVGGPDARRNQWGLEIPDRSEWNFEEVEDYGDRVRFRVYDDGGRYDGYASVSYNDGDVHIGEMAVGLAGEGTDLSDVRMNGLVDAALQDWFYNDLQQRWPGIYRVSFETVNSAASINRGWSNFLTNWMQQGTPGFGYYSGGLSGVQALRDQLPTLAAFTPEQLQRIPFGRILEQMSLEERQNFAYALRGAHQSGRNIVRDIPEYRLTPEGAANRASHGAGLPASAVGSPAPRPLEDWRGHGLTGYHGVQLPGGNILVSVPDPTGNARGWLVDQRTLAVPNPDLPTLRDGELGRALYVPRLTERPNYATLRNTLADEPMSVLNERQRNLIVDYAKEQMEQLRDDFYSRLDEAGDYADDVEDPLNGIEDYDIAQVLESIREGSTEMPEWLRERLDDVGWSEITDPLAGLRYVTGEAGDQLYQLVNVIGMMDDTDLLLELRGRASVFADTPPPEVNQQARDLGAELVYRAGYPQSARELAIISPHSVARVDRQWTSQAVQESAFNTRVGNAGYLQFGQDAPNRAAVEITRAAEGRATPEEMARVEQLLPEDAWRIINERVPEPTGGQRPEDLLDRMRIGTGQQREPTGFMVVDPEADGIATMDHTTLRRNQRFNDDEVHVELPGLDVPGNPIEEYNYVAGEQPYWDQSATGVTLPHEARDYTSTQATSAEAAMEIAERWREVLMPQWARMFGPEGVSWRTKGLQEIESAASRLPAGAFRTDWTGVQDIAGARIVHPDALRDPMKVLQEAVMGIDPQTIGGTPRIWTADQTINVPDVDGTRAYTVVLQMPGGAPLELQLMTPAMHKAEEATWRTRVWIGEKIRELRMRENNYEAIPIEEWEEVEKAGRYMQGIWEGVTDDIRAEFMGQRLPEMRRVMNELRYQIGRELTDPLIAQGFSPAAALDAQYLPLRLSRGARWDKDTGEFVDGPSVMDLDNEIGQEGLPQPVYYPKYDARTPRKFTDWLLPRRTQGIRARTQRPGYEMRNTGYLTLNDLYVKDPFEAYARRASLAVRKREALSLVENITRKFGRRIQDGDVIADNEVVFAPDFLRRFYKMRVKVDDEVMRQVQRRLAANGYEGEAFAMDEGMWNLVKQTIVENQDEMVGLTSRGVELWAIPKIVGDRLEASMSPLLGTNARLFWDTPTNLWRGMALAGSPRWIINNLFGNILFLKMQGGALTDVIRQFSPRFRNAVRGAIGEEALSAVEGGLFGTVGAYNTKLGRAGQTAIGQMYGSIGKSPVGRGFHKFGEFMRGLNSEVENAFRRASYIRAAERTAMKAGLRKTGRSFWTTKTSLEKIWGTGTDEALWRKAVNEVNYFFNDYNAMSPFGRQVMRRFLVPFWGFYRHVARLLFTFPWEHPVRFAAMRQLAQLGNEMEAEYSGGLPDWARGFVPIGPGAEDLETRFMSTRGPDPFSAIFQSPVSLVHPLIKAGFEWATGRSTLSGREFTDPSVAAGFGSDEQYRVVPREGGGYEVERVEAVRPSVWEMLASQIPQYDLLKDAIAGGRTYDTATLYDAIFDRRGAVRTDPATGEPYTPFNALDALSRMFGITTYDINLTAEQQQELEDRRNAILAVLRQSGYVPSDESVAQAAQPSSSGGYAASKLGGF